VPSAHETSAHYFFGGHKNHPSYYKPGPLLSLEQ
jgi:hypothetical protein